MLWLQIIIKCHNTRRQTQLSTFTLCHYGCQALLLGKFSLWHNDRWTTQCGKFTLWHNDCRDWQLGRFTLLYNASWAKQLCKFTFWHNRRQATQHGSFIVRWKARAMLPNGCQMHPLLNSFRMTEWLVRGFMTQMTKPNCCVMFVQGLAPGDPFPAKETKWTSLEVRTHATFLETSISK